MHILVIDGAHVEAEFRAKFGPGHEYSFLLHPWNAPHGEHDSRKEALRKAGNTAGVIFDFGWYSYVVARPTQVVFTLTTEQNLLDKVKLIKFSPANKQPTSSEALTFPLFGFCGLPTLLNRPLLEVSLYDEADREKLAETCAALGTDYRVVQDRVGLVTPRIICMIINEACYTLQEGTASIKDIDLSMKLGTGYPRGPFEWANAIGVARVYAVLEALWDDTHDERYKVCPLLKRQALRDEAFAL